MIFFNEFAMGYGYMMYTRGQGSLVCLLALVFSQVVMAYDCVEISTFVVERDNFSTKEYERAAETPEEFLKQFQHATVGEIIRSDNGLTAVKAQESECPDAAQTLQFGGTVTDFKAGNQNLRYWVGFGAGKQKLAVDAWLREKLSGDVIHQDEIVDRKWAGFGGGDDRKGVSDFAEKVEKFIEKALKPPKSRN